MIRLHGLRPAVRARIGLAHSRLATATCGTIRLKLLKIGAQMALCVRIAMASVCPSAAEIARAHLRLCC